ncbi:MAG: YncE family protein [Gillisia sp.]
MKKFFTLGLLVFLTYSSCNAQNYKIIQKFSVPGDNWWDYLNLDENSGRLFISHGDQTQVIDKNNGKLLGTIPNTPGVHGIAFDASQNKAFITCGGDNSVRVVNLKTLDLLDNIKIEGENPDAILYDDFSDRIFVYNGRSNDATVINPNTNKVVATIPFEGKPEASATDHQGKVYINIEDKSLIDVIDTKTMKVVNSWSVSPGEEPSGLALDTKTNRLFSVCANKKMVILDSRSGKLISTLDTGAGTDGCVFDSELNRAYSSNGEGTLTMVQEENANSFKVIANVQTQPGARTICLDTKTHHLYLSTAAYGPAPEPSTENPHPRRPISPGTFTILDIAPVN